MQHIDEPAQNNLLKLGANPYPGRGIILGRTKSGNHLVQIYWIMGRSANSRNRVFRHDGFGRLFTDSADAATAGDTSLTLYNAMNQCGASYIVSNGDQTDTVIKNLGHTNLSGMLAGRTYEPDAPNFTQRITGMFELHNGFRASLSIIRRTTFGASCQRILHEYDEIPPGFGYFISTYSGDGTPLPSFLGDPLIIPIEGEGAEIAKDYWRFLSPENRVSIAVKIIPTERKEEIHIINKY